MTDPVIIRDYNIYAGLDYDPKKNPIPIINTQTTGYFNTFKQVKEK